VVSLRDGVSAVGSVMNWGMGVVGRLVVLSSGVVHTQVLGIIVQVVIVVDNDGLVAVHVLDDSEWIELDLVRDLVLSADQDAVVEDLDEVLHVLLDLDLVPVDTDSGVGDGEALLLVRGLDLDLHDTLLEECHVDIKMCGTVLHGVGEVLVVVQVEPGVDGILVNDQAIWLDIVSCHEVVASVKAVLIVVSVSVVFALKLVMVSSKQLAEP